MQYRVIGNVMPAVEMRLEYGESVFTQSGGMAWMSDAIAMETNTHGGFMKGLGRLFAGESMFMTTYTAQAAKKAQKALTLSRCRKLRRDWASPSFRGKEAHWMR